MHRKIHILWKHWAPPLLGAALAVSSISAQDLRELHSTLNLRFTPPTESASKGLISEGNPKIDPMLRSLNLGGGSKSIGEFASEAKAMQIPSNGNLISVVLTADRESSVNALRARVEDAGGNVSVVIDEAILARIPAGAIETLGAAEHLEYLAPQGMVQVPNNQRAESIPTGTNGVLMTRANLLHKRGLVGRGVKVGIIDFGFTGYRTMRSSGRVPEPKAVKAFGADGGWDRGDHGTVHGAACAEIIHAMAPDAELYLASIGDGSGRAGDDEIAQAAEWLAAQGAQIISFSGGGHVGPHNGTALLDRLVEIEVRKGILWVNAAGNEGQSHWSTVPKMDENNLVLADGKPFVLMQSATTGIAAQVSWDDWGANPLNPTSSQDFDAYLFAVSPSGELQLVSKSENPQNGRGAPREVVGAPSAQGQVFALFIVAKHVSRNVRLHVHMMTPGLMQPLNPVGSISIPATSPLALAVGAVDVHTAKLEPYSSQGPTDDNRAKPELSGPDKVESLAYKGEFPGTSAACPHVAGFAALVKQARPGANQSQLVSLLVAATSPLADNEGAGRGLIDGSRFGGGRTETGNVLPARPGLVNLPKSFGGAVAIGKLDILVDNGTETETPMGAKIVVGKKSYQVGDGMKIGFKADEDCYYAVIHRASNGDYTVIAPRQDDDPKLEAGRKYALPAGGQTIQVAPPTGHERVILICSKEPIRLDELENADRRNLAVAIAEYDIVEER